jgi:hypothetical protein
VHVGRRVRGQKRTLTLVMVDKMRGNLSELGREVAMDEQDMHTRIPQVRRGPGKVAMPQRRETV